MLPYVLMGIGPVVLVVGLLLMRSADAASSSQEVVEGTLVRWEHRHVGSSTNLGSLGSLPVVRFRTTDGREVEGKPRRAADRGIYRTGHRVQVRYDRADPTSFLVRQGWLDRPYAFVVLVGAGLTLLSVVLPVVFSALG